MLLGGNHRSKLKVTTDLQAFALIVTAEPYYAVRQPSNVVVLENVVREDTKGTTEAVNAKYELMERGGYIPTGYKFDPVILNAKLPLEFFEARNALRIAQSEGAEQYAGDSYQHAVQLMNNVDEDATRKHMDRKPLIAVAREAVQTAEDARQVAVKKMDEVRLADERQASADVQAQTQAQADDATRQRIRLSLIKPAPRSQQRVGTACKRQRPRRNLTQRELRPTLPKPSRTPQSEIRYGRQPSCISHCTVGCPERCRTISFSSATSARERAASGNRESRHAHAVVRQLNSILQTHSARGLRLGMSRVGSGVCRINYRPEPLPLERSPCRTGLALSAGSRHRPAPVLLPVRR